MATRMQQRRGTAAQWISSNNGDGPILNAGEIGFETDTGKFKIGDGTNHWVDLDYFLDESDIDGITGDYVLANTLGQANGVATLDSSGKLTSSQIPGIDELAQDAVDLALVAGTGITKSYNDNANTITLSVDTSTIQSRVANVTDTEIGYLDGVTSNVQAQLDAKAALAGAAFTGNISTTGNLQVDGNFTVNGSNVLVSATQIQIEDSILQLAHENAANTVDLGIVAGYNDGTAKHAGLVKDATDGKWKLFKGVTTEPSTTVDFTQATLDDLTVGALESSSINVANATVTGTITAGGGVGTNGQVLQSTGTGVQWGTVTGYSAPTIGSTSIASGATVTTIAGLTLTEPTLTGTVNASGDINLSAANGPGSLIDELTLIMMGAL